MPSTTQQKQKQLLTVESVARAMQRTHRVKNVGRPRFKKLCTNIKKLRRRCAVR